MSNPLTMKLEQYTRFSIAERARLDALAAHPTQTFAAGQVILSEGQKAESIHLVLNGFALRSKTLWDGSRQILAFLIPGDLCDIEVFVLQGMDHDIVAMERTICTLIPVSEMERLLSEYSTLTRALWWSTMTDSAVLRSRIIGQGRRDARERMAHIFYEVLIRYRMVGQGADDGYSFPLTQQDLADATGMTPIHANRTLQQLRSEGLVEFAHGRLRVLDADGLKQAARFESNYLHLDRTDRDADVSGRAGDLA